MSEFYVTLDDLCHFYGVPTPEDVDDDTLMRIWWGEPDSLCDGWQIDAMYSEWDPITHEWAPETDEVAEKLESAYGRPLD